MGYIDSNGGQSSHLTFSAILALDSYSTTADRLQYFKHKYFTDVITDYVAGTGYALYKKENIMPTAVDYVNVYRPICKDPTKTDVPIIVTFRGTDSIFDVVKDVALGLNYASNGYLNATLSTVYAELDTVVGALEEFATTERPLHFISHSLGSMLSNYVAYKLMTRGVTTALITQEMFNPYLLVDEYYEYFRDVDSSTYDSKSNIQIHTIENDYVTGLVSTYGIGTVYEYEITDTAPASATPALSPGVAGLSAWLINTFNDLTGAETSSLMRSTYNTASHHSIESFGALTSSIQQYQIYDSIGYLTQHNTYLDLSIRTVRTRMLGRYGVDLPERHLYLQDIEVRDLLDNSIYAGYHSNDVNNRSYHNNAYHFTVSTHGYNDYVLGTNHNGEPSVSFPVVLTNVASQIPMIPLMVVPIIVHANNEYVGRFLIYKNDNTLVGLNSHTGATSAFVLPQPLVEYNQSLYDGSTLAIQERFQFTLEDGHIFTSNRRNVEQTVMDVFDLEIGQSMTVRFTNDILQADGTVKQTGLYKWRNNGQEYMMGSDYVSMFNPEPNSAIGDWHVTFEAINSAYNSANGDPHFLEFLHKIEITNGNFYASNPDRRAIGQIDNQGMYNDTFANSSTGETTDNTQRYIQLLSRNGNVCEVYIFAYINGQLHYLEGQNENEVGYHPTAIDPSVSTGMISTPLWYPVDSNYLIIDPNGNAKWTMTIQ